MPQCQGGKGGPSSTGTSMQHEALQRQTQGNQKAESRNVALPEKKVSHSSEEPSSAKVSTSTTLESSAGVQTKPSPTIKTSTESKQTVNATTPVFLKTVKTVPPLSALSRASKRPSVKTPPYASKSQVSTSFLKKSKFTWVKSQNVEGVEPKQASSTSSPTQKAVNCPPLSGSKAEVASGSSPLFSVSRRTPAKKLPRRLSPVTVVPKTSKYKWVSSSAGAQTKTSRKLSSPKALTLSQRGLEKGAATKKLRVVSAPSAKIKKAIAPSSVSSSPSSRYRWKAGGQSTSAAVTGGSTVARHKSAFHWTSAKSNKVVKGGLVGSPSATPQTSIMPSSSPGGFKLRSRMKIIRKSASR